MEWTILRSPPFWCGWWWGMWRHASDIDDLLLELSCTVVVRVSSVCGELRTSGAIRNQHLIIVFQIWLIDEFTEYSPTCSDENQVWPCDRDRDSYLFMSTLDAQPHYDRSNVRRATILPFNTRFIVTICYRNRFARQPQEKLSARKFRPLTVMSSIVYGCMRRSWGLCHPRFWWYANVLVWSDIS